MICWSCERAAGAEPFCESCGAVQPPGPVADRFAVLGAPRRYDLDLTAIEARYRELTRKLHPDRFARADPRARRASLEQSVRLNEAWKTLKDPIRRAEYMLSLAGVGVDVGGGGGGGDTDQPGAREGLSTRATLRVPQTLLAEVLELRSELGEARQTKDDVKVQAMAAAMRARATAATQAVAAGLDAGDAAGLEQAAREIVALRYYRRFLDEVERHDEENAAAAPRAEDAS